MSKLAPAPHDETPAYKKFSAVFVPALLMVTLALVYLLTSLVSSWLVEVASQVRDNVPVLRPRLDYLGKIDQRSEAAYIGSLVCFVFILPSALFINMAFYLKTVVVSGEANAISFSSAYGMIFSLSVTFAFIWIAFVSVPHGYDPSKPGMAAILAWPIFPAIASGVIVVSSLIAFSTFVGIAKFLLMGVKRSG